MSKKTKKQKIIPNGDLVLVERDEIVLQESEGGVIRTENTEQEKKTTGTIKEVSPDLKNLVPEGARVPKKGDRVVFGVFAGDPLQLDELGKVEYVLLHARQTEHYENQILAFLEE